MTGTPVDEGPPEALAMEFVLGPGDLIRAQFWYFFNLWFIRFVYVVNAIAAFALVRAIAGRGMQPQDVKGFMWLSVWFVLIPAVSIWSGWSHHRRLKARVKTS